MKDRTSRFHLDPALGAYLDLVARAMPGRLLLVLALMLAGSLTEGVGLLMLVPLLQLVGLDTQQGAMGGIQQLVGSWFALVGLSPTLATVLVIYVVVVSLNGVLRRTGSILSLSVGYHLEALMRRRSSDFSFTMRVYSPTSE